MVKRSSTVDSQPADLSQQSDAERQAAWEAKQAAIAPWRWLARVEWLCVRGFVKDQALIDRATAKLQARKAIADYEARAAVADPSPKDERYGRKPAAIGEFKILGPLGDVLNVYLTADEHTEALQTAQGWMAKRDALAVRLERDPQRRWMSEETDEYNLGRKSYSRRLGHVGAIMADLGWIEKASSEPWLPVVRNRSGMDDPQRIKDAEANAAAMCK